METSLCRICLSSDLGFGLFDAEVESISLLWKLELCLHEQVVDKPGYPRRICKTCCDNLNITSNFINKYRETRELLKSKLIDNGHDNIYIKEEFLDYCDDTVDNDSVYELQMVENIKVETNSCEKFTVDKLLTNCKDITVKKICCTDTRAQAQVSAHVQVKTVKKDKSQAKIKKDKCNSTLKSKDKIQTKIKNGTIIKERNEKKRVKLKNVIKEQNGKKRTKLENVIKEKPCPSEPGQYLCDICAAVLNSTRSLDLHKISVHFPTKAQCEQCPKVFRSAYHLKRHVENSHMAGRYMCPTCGMSFYKNNVLTNHIKVVHLKTRVRRDKCPLCKKTYANKMGLLVHHRSAHTGERPAVCEVCGASFFHEVYLREHMRLHTGETPFKCLVCNRGYAIRSNMVSHMKHNHRISDIDQETLAKLSPAILKKLKP